MKGIFMFGVALLLIYCIIVYGRGYKIYEEEESKHQNFKKRLYDCVAEGVKHHPFTNNPDDWDTFEELGLKQIEKNCAIKIENENRLKETH